MKLGCNIITYLLGGYSAEAALERLHYFGIPYADFSGCGAFQNQFYSVKEIAGIAKKLEQLDMRANSIVSMPVHNPGSFRLEERLCALEEVKGAGGFIKAVGGKFILVSDLQGRADYAEDLDLDQAFDNSVDFAKRLCEWADKEGLHILLELKPVGGSFYKIERMKQMIDEVQAPNLWANIDLGHCYLQKMNGKRFAQLGKRLVNVHISDNLDFGYEADLIIGEGKTDFKTYFQYLLEMDLDANCKEAGFEECVAAIECLPAPYIENPDYAVLKSRDYIYGTLPGLFNKC